MYFILMVRVRVEVRVRLGLGLGFYAFIERYKNDFYLHLFYGISQALHHPRMARTV